MVEIERDTGVISLREYYSVDDCGPRISPMLVEGQVHGGLAQGIGQALLEEIVFDDQGQLLTGSMMDYTMPRADNFPTFTIDQTETPTTLNPLGAKGIGEAATIGSTPAVVNAGDGCAGAIWRASSRYAADAAQSLGSDSRIRLERTWASSEDFCPLINSIDSWSSDQRHVSYRVGSRCQQSTR